MGFFEQRAENAAELLDWVSKLDGDICCVKKYPKQKAHYGYFGALNKRVVQAVKARGIERPYLHQAQAIDSVLEGQDVVIVTPTASGKTLCYNLPVADSIVHDLNSRALYLFPTKALAQDQLKELNELSDKLDGIIKTFTYDGDTPADKRQLARSEGNIIITNPDMLSAGILPHHAAWANFFQNLKYIVVDELHSYRGIFGSHLANLFARLDRICAFYGSHPVFICCSATIANPKEHAEALTGRTMQLIEQSGAASCEKKFMIYNPKLLDKEKGIRRSALFESARIAAEALCRGISTIIFTRSRLNVELMLKSLRQKLLQEGKNPNIVAGYRGGYLPKERRMIEHGLQSGKLLGVVSTNALELGIDIGALELAVIHGYQGSIASVRQQFGRVGRRGEVAACVLVASASAVDQFFAANPNWLLDAPSEVARIDPSNPYIQVNHIRCAAFELPFEKKETFAGRDISEILEYLARHGVLSLSGDKGNEHYYWQGNNYPAADLSLRSATGETYAIIDVSDERRARLIGTMDKHSAPVLIFPGAIYFHAGQSYIVQKLDAEKLECYVKSVASDYYTESETSARITLTEEFERKGNFGWGEAVLATAPKMYRKIKLTAHENIGHGEINLPEDQMETTVCWFAVPRGEEENSQLAQTLAGLVNLLGNVAPLLLMCDKNDIQITYRINDAQLECSAIFIADNIPGGVGLAEGAFELGNKLLEAARDALRGCKCESGCPACVGTTFGSVVDLKKSVLGLIEKMLINSSKC